MSMVKKWWNELVADFREMVAEITKPTASEAWVRKYAPFQRDEILALGIEAWKCGLTVEEIAPAAVRLHVGHDGEATAA